MSLDSESVQATGPRGSPEEVLNLSASGFAIATTALVRAGTQEKFTLALRDGTLKVEVTAEVASYRKLARPGLHALGYGFVAPTQGAPVRRLLVAAMHGKPGARPRVRFSGEAVWSWPSKSVSSPVELLDFGWSGATATGDSFPPVGTPILLALRPGETREMVAVPARIASVREGGAGSIVDLTFGSDENTSTALSGLIEALLFTQRELPAPPPECPPGTRIGSFEVGSLLSRGRMTEVYRAHLLDGEGNPERSVEFGMRRFSDPRAILPPNVVGPRGFDLEIWNDRFLEAAQFGGLLLGNERVLKVFGATSDRAESWLATELHEGTSFERVLAQCTADRKFAPVNGVISLISEVLLALDECHRTRDEEERVAVHGDLRASSVLIGETGEVKLVGFGNARRSHELPPGAMPPDRVASFAPEWSRAGAEATPKSDVYQVGVLLYAGLTGAPPFAAERIDQLEALIAARPPPPSRLNVQVPAQLDRAVLSALALRAEDRPTARALAEALRVGASHAREATVSGRPDPLDRVLSRSTARSTPSAPETTEPNTDKASVAARSPIVVSGLVQAWKPAEKSLEPGDHLGRYEVLGKVTKGGMAEVYLARALGKYGAVKPLVLLKTILPGEAARTESVRLFLNEARVAALIFHPNVVELYDFGFDKGRPYLVMEWVEGVNLAQLMMELRRQGKQLPPGLAGRIISDCSAGLAYAHGLTDARGHSLDIVHRDVSAKNILVSYSGEVKLLDFGIAKFRDSSELTRAGMVRGTAGYLSPEQIAERRSTGLSDVWALGINLYHLLTGSTPFQRENFLKTVSAAVHHQQPPAHEVQPLAPVELSRIADRALQKAPENRFADAGAMRAELEHWLSGQRAGPRELGAFVDALFPNELESERRRLADVTARPLTGKSTDTVPAHQERRTDVQQATPPRSIETTPLAIKAPRGDDERPSLDFDAPGPTVRVASYARLPVAPLPPPAPDAFLPKASPARRAPITLPMEEDRGEDPTIVVPMPMPMARKPFPVRMLGLGAGAVVVLVGLGIWVFGGAEPKPVIAPIRVAQVDAGVADAGPVDAGAEDAGVDAGVEDAGAPELADAGVVPDEPLTPLEPIETSATPAFRVSCNIACMVVVDGETRGPAPITVSVQRAGKHAVKLLGSSPFGQSVKELVAVAATGEVSEVHGTFKTGLLSIRSSSPVKVLVSGRKLWTPINGMPIIEGKHEVMAFHRKFGTRRQTVVVKPDKKTEIRIDFSKR